MDPERFWKRDIQRRITNIEKKVERHLETQRILRKRIRQIQDFIDSIRDPQP